MNYLQITCSNICHNKELNNCIKRPSINCFLFKESDTSMAGDAFTVSHVAFGATYSTHNTLANLLLHLYISIKKRIIRAILTNTYIPGYRIYISRISSSG